MLSIASSHYFDYVVTFILKFDGDLELKRLDLERPSRLNGGDS